MQVGPKPGIYSSYMSANTMPVIVSILRKLAQDSFRSVAVAVHAAVVHVKGWSVLEVHGGFVKETLELKPYAYCLCAVSFVFAASWA